MTKRRRVITSESENKEQAWQLDYCPCCGGHAEMRHGSVRSDNGWVVCMDCGLSTRYYDDPAEAAAAWNRRAA